MSNGKDRLKYITKKTNSMGYIMKKYKDYFAKKGIKRSGSFSIMWNKQKITEDQRQQIKDANGLKNASVMHLQELYEV